MLEAIEGGDAALELLASLADAEGSQEISPEIKLKEQELNDLFGTPLTED